MSILVTAFHTPLVIERVVMINILCGLFFFYGYPVRLQMTYVFRIRQKEKRRKKKRPRLFIVSQSVG